MTSDGESAAPAASEAAGDWRWDLRGGLRRRMFIAFGFVFVLGMGVQQVAQFYGIPGSGFHGQFGEERERQLRGLNLVADLKVERLTRWMQERKDDLAVVLRSGHVQSYLNELELLLAGGDARHGRRAPHWRMVEGSQVHTDLMHDLNVVRAEHGIYGRILITDGASGTVVVSTDATQLGTSVRDEPYFTSPLLTPDTTHIGILRDEASGELKLTISRTVQHPDAQPGSRANEADGVVAVVIMEIDSEDLIKPMLHTGDGLGLTGEALLVDENVTILTSLKHRLADGTTATPLRYQIDAEPARRAARGEQGTVESLDYRGVQVLAAYRHVRLTPLQGWGLVVKQDEAEIFAPLRQSVMSGLLAGGVALLALLVMAGVVANGLSRPIQNLGRAAQQVEGGNLAARAPLGSTGEVGALTTAFNSMVERVQHWHEELEIQVTHRTAELQHVNAQLEAEVRERTHAEENLERQAQDLARSNADLEQFAYVASHDLQEPLRVVGTYAKLLGRRYKGRLDADVDEFIGFIGDGVLRMHRLINDLLAYSRVGKGTGQLVRTDTEETLRGVLDNLQSAVKENGAVITHDPLPTVMAYTTQIAQPFQNLISNAVKFRGADPPRVHISAAREEAEWVFSVSDNGQGIDPRHHGQIFVIFRRLHGHDDYPGTGIGLAICKKIVERRGGRIWVESEAGRGATFYFTVPAVNGEQPNPAMAEDGRFERGRARGIA